MFIRKKIKTNKDQIYIQHQLIKSIRTSSGPRQEVVLNLGQLDISKDKWKSLANAIEKKLNNNQESFSFSNNDDEIEKSAEHFSQIIIRANLNKQKDLKIHNPIKWDEVSYNEELGEDYEMVDINSTETTESRSIGAEYVILDQMEKYKFDEILKETGMDEKQIDYAKCLIAGRAVHPSSERELSRWINENSGLKELINSEVKVYDNALHRVAVNLWNNKAYIEGQLRKEAKDLFSLDEKIILYDLTNTYFEGRKEGCEIAQFALSKEKRNDCKLATLALVVDSEGFPKESKILKGNISESGTLPDILKSIKNMGKSEKKTIVIDAGIAIEENIKLIKKEKMSYVAISRKQKYEKSLWDDSEEKKIVLNDKKTKLRLKLAVIETGEKDEENNLEKEAYLLCQSPLKEIKEKQIFESRINKFEKSLKKLNSGLKKPRTQKKYDKILERIGRLKEKYHVGSYFNIEVNHENNLVKEIIFKKNLKALDKIEKFGEYVIRTNRLDLSESDISSIHRSLSNIESSFRSMKSELGMRPNFHKKNITTIAHIFITVIAYHMVCAIIKRLSNAGINYTWNTVRNILSSHDRVITRFNTDDNQCIYVSNTVNANSSQKTIYDKLELKHNPLRKIKFKIPIKKEKINVVPKN